MSVHRRNSVSSVSAKDTDQLLDEDDDDSYAERKYTSHIPWKGITLALTLTLIGSMMLVAYTCSMLNLIEFKPVDPSSFLCLAFITIIPGFYHCFIAFRAFRGHEGYSFDDIADLN